MVIDISTNPKHQVAGTKIGNTELQGHAGTMNIIIVNNVYTYKDWW